MGILVKEESLKEVDNQHCDTRYLGLEIQVFAEPAHNLTLSNFLIFFLFSLSPIKFASWHRALVSEV